MHYSVFHSVGFRRMAHHLRCATDMLCASCHSVLPFLSACCVLCGGDVHSECGTRVRGDTYCHTCQEEEQEP